MFQSFTIILALAALLSYINQRFLKLPTTIGIMILALGLSLPMGILQVVNPELFYQACQVVDDLDFRYILMDIMLSFLLFAGGLHIKAKDLSQEKIPVMVFATLGVLISTALVGAFTYLVLNVFSLNVPFSLCLLFGALISPTDPIAVLAILKELKISKSLETKIAGESLFNDGVGVVVFISILQFITMGDDFSWGEVVIIFAEEAVGGMMFGLGLGYLGYRLLKSIEESPKMEVLITIAIASGGYSLASLIHVSGPLAMVVAGLFMGSMIRGPEFHYESKIHLDIFWEVLDEILNAVLFVLIGLEILTIAFDLTYFAAGLVSIILVLLARFLSVGATYSILKHKMDHTPSKTMAIMTWGGLRGGISIALALSISVSDYRDLVVVITYVVVIFSIIVQGLTLGKVIKALKID